MCKLKKIFGKERVIGLAGNKSSGKSNNLMALVKDFRKDNQITPIYVFGFDENTLSWLRQFKGIYEVSSLDQMADKRNSLLLIDEMQKLDLSNRRYKERIDAFIDFIYHNNNWCILSSPNLREFNTVIGSKIERWLLKSLNATDLINGSQLKDKVISYRGRYKSMDSIVLPPNLMLVINDKHEIVLDLEYIPEVDTKKTHIDIFDTELSENVAPESQKIVVEVK